MGRTLPSVTQVFLHEQESFTRFRRALRRSDQHALDDLFAAAHQHLAAAAYASHALPFEIFLLAMLLEEHKQVLRMQTRLEHLYRSSGMGGQWDEFIPIRVETQNLASLPPPSEAADPADGGWAADLPAGDWAAEAQDDPSEAGLAGGKHTPNPPAGPAPGKTG
jgi:hypothetical protein